MRYEDDARHGPAVALCLMLAGCAVLLSLPLVLPIGPMYWDMMIYLDAAQRIAQGQVPVVDFFAPVGPLPYWLFALVERWFPDGHHLLVAQWSTLLVSAPLMALALWKAERRLAWAVLAAFAVFALLPFNTRSFYPYPGSDAFAIYNRQTSHFLFVVVATLFVSPSGWLRTLALAGAMLALFLTKSTGFTAAGLVCVLALVSGRVTWREAATVGLIFAIPLGVMQLWNGLPAQYLLDVWLLVTLNSGGLVERLFQGVSINLGVIVPAAALALLLLWTDRPDWRSLPGHPAVALAVVSAAGVLFESQNTGGQAMILLLPLVLAIALPLRAHWPVVVLAGATVLPSMIFVSEAALRTWGGAVKNERLAHETLGTLGNVNARPRQFVMERNVRDIIVNHRPAFDAFEAADELPSFIGYSEFDFQLRQLMEADRAVLAMQDLEREHGVRFERILALNFVNPYPWIMGRDAPRHVAIGADPTRAVPRPGSLVLEAVADTDIVLRPICPPTRANVLLHDLYAPALTEHVRMALTPCTEVWVHPRHAARMR